MGKPCQLPEDRIKELQFRFRAYERNRPKNLCREFGITPGVLRYYVKLRVRA